MSALPVQDIFESLHEAGLSISLASNGGIKVSPSSRLTDDLRTLIRGNKAFLLDWLNAANDPAPEPPPDPNAWRELAQAYHATTSIAKTALRLAVARCTACAVALARRFGTTTNLIEGQHHEHH